MDRKANIICCVVVGLCAAFCAATYYGFNYIEGLRQSLEDITSEYNALEQETTTMIQKKRVYEEAFLELDKLKVSVGGNVDFYDEAQKAIGRGGARVISNSAGASANGRISMTMSFAGDYYSIMRALAELRGLPNVVRVVTLNLVPTNTDTSVNSDIRADITLEALAYQ